MLDKRKTDLWNALGIGPQWIERDRLIKAAAKMASEKAAPKQEPVRTLASAAGVPQPSPTASESSSSLVSARAASSQAKTQSRPTPAPRAPSNSAALAAPKNFSESRGTRPDAYSSERIQKIESADWGTLQTLVQDCRACEISSRRLKPVFGEGPHPCKLMLIGEAPGAEEDQQGRPFVGVSGRLLDRILEAAGLDRQKDLFLCNTLKCRPPLNATPEKAETLACKPFLSRQIQLADPDVIVAMGKPAASWFFPELRALTPYRGKVHELMIEGRTRKVIVTYHPSYLLRSPLEKRKAWLDWCLVLDNLN